MAYLHGVSSLPAPKLYSKQEVFEAARIWLEGDPGALELFERLHGASRTESRSYVLSLQEILALEGQVERVQQFVVKGLPLACQAVEHALSAAALRPENIDTVVYTSCTAPMIPALDVTILQQLGFSPRTKRIPIYQQGCAGGVVGLGLANRLCEHGGNALIISLELCSLLFRLRESDGVHLLGSALFADGAAASVISSKEGKLRFVGAQSHLIPESIHLMGYEIREDGPHLRLDRELPSALQGVVREVIDQFLASHARSAGEIPWWIIHPGGVRILEGLTTLFSLRPEQYCWAYDVLSEIGNVSSATVQFVLSRFLQAQVAKPGEQILMVGIGPGLTIELILFEYA